jgi:serine/threonine-protein kinase
MALIGVLGTRSTGDDAVRYVNIQLPDTAPLVFIGEAPGGTGQPALALSPDGQRIVYVGRADTTTRLYVRDLGDGFAVRPLMGTEGAYAPCMSPDGASVAFFAGGRLKRVALDDVQVTPITEAYWSRGCSWSDDGRIVTNVGDNREFVIAPATGGTVQRRRLSREFGKWMSQAEWLPGNEWLLDGCSQPNHLCAYSLDAEDVRFLAMDGPPTARRGAASVAGTSARFLEPNYLLFSHPADNVLMGLRFDPNTLTAEGERVVLQRGVRRENARGLLQIAFSTRGDFLFAEGENAIEAQFVWADATGAVERLPFRTRVYGAFRLSDDGRFIAARVVPPTGPDELWIMDLERRVEERWTAGQLLAGRSLGAHEWLPDSRRLLVAGRGDPSVLLEVDARTASGGRVLWEGSGSIIPERVGATGNAFMRVDSAGPSMTYLTLTRIDDLERLPGGPAEDALPPVDGIPAAGVLTDFSPDGDWFAYSSTETGPYEVYAQRLEPGSRPYRISRGGELPRFSPRGDGVYYRDGQRWYFVAFTGDDAEPFAAPRFVLEGEYQNVAGPEFEVAPDGRRLLLLERTAASSTTTLHLILNWRKELEERLGGGQ